MLLKGAVTNKYVTAVKIKATTESKLDDSHV